MNFRVRELAAIVGTSMLISAGVASAADPEVRCQTAKLKAIGKVRACLERQKANVLLGKSDESAACFAKFQTTKSKLDAKAASTETSCRFVDNGDGTVTDLNTALVWEKKTDDLTIHSKDDTYQWTIGSPYGPSGGVFTTFLYELNGGTSNDGASSSGCFNGYCDWRLPTVDELQDIRLAADPCGTSPCLDPVFGPTAAAGYWTTTSYSLNLGYLWVVNFNNGSIYDVHKSGLNAARAVRGGL